MVHLWTSTLLSKQLLHNLSSSSSNERVKRVQGTPTIIEDDSSITPAIATNKDIPASDYDTSVGIPMNMDFAIQQGYSTMNNAEDGPSTWPNTIERKNRKNKST